MNNIPNIKKKYIKPELVAVAIDQEITLVMFSIEEPPIPVKKSASASSLSNEIFGSDAVQLGGTNPQYDGGISRE